MLIRKLGFKRGGTRDEVRLRDHLASKPQDVGKKGALFGRWGIELANNGINLQLCQQGIQLALPNNAHRARTAQTTLRALLIQVLAEQMLV